MSLKLLLVFVLTSGQMLLLLLLFSTPTLNSGNLSANVCVYISLVMLFVWHLTMCVYVRVYTSNKTYPKQVEFMQKEKCLLASMPSNKNVKSDLLAIATNGLMILLLLLLLKIFYTFAHYIYIFVYVYTYTDGGS